MTNKQLRKLGRRELLEILLIQSRELEQVKQELKEARAELAERQIAIANSGSIAEAALKLSGIFEVAQEAADRYLEGLAVPVKARRTVEAPVRRPEPKVREDSVPEIREMCDQIPEDTLQESAESLIRAEELRRHMQYDALRRELNLLLEESSYEPRK